MANQNSQQRRKQLLKQRQADEQREADRDEVEFLYRDAYRAHSRGDLPVADRVLKRVLILDPDHNKSLSLLAQIHATAGHDAEALAYLRRLQKLDDDPSLLFNIGVLYHEMQQPEKAAEYMRQFLAASK